MRASWLAALLLLVIPLCLFGQNVEFSKKNFPGKQKELNNALDEIKRGDAYFDAGNFVYYKALDHYERAHSFNPNNAELNFKLGACYLYSSTKQKSIEFLEKARQLDPKVDDRLYYFLGLSYHLSWQWEKAIEDYQEYLKRFPQTKNKKILGTERKIEECRNGIELMKDTLRLSKLPDSARFRIENLGQEINSSYGDYHPLLSADQSELIFTSRRAETTGGGLSNDGKFYEDVYRSEFENGKWRLARNIGEPINGYKQNNATCGMSVDGQTLFLYVDDLSLGTGNIYESKKKGNEWTKPVRMSKNINSRFHESSASLSPDGLRLYFCSQNKTGNQGVGTHDIYVVKRANNTDEWGEPENLGPVINTPLGEQTVFMHPDGKTIYFSSQGHNSMGGYDLFRSVYDDSLKQWSKPVNLGYPVNSPDDDLDFVVSADGKTGYYATIRPEGYGDKDIYRIHFPADTTPKLTLVKGLVTDESENPVGGKVIIQDSETGLVLFEQEANTATGKFLLSLPSGKKYELLVKSDGYEEYREIVEVKRGEKYKELDINIKLKRKEQIVSIEGEITDENGNPLKGNIEIINNSTGEVIFKGNSNELGNYVSKLKGGKNYGIVVSSDGYLFQSINLDIPPDKEKIKLPPIKLKKIEAGKNIVLNNIFFDFDRSSLRPDSKPELLRVAKVLNENPGMKIEISGHTDSKGSASYNLKLSEERAKSVVDFLIQNGIERSRLKFKGYGLLNPIADNDTEEGRQMNRRTEFKVLEVVTPLPRPANIKPLSESSNIPSKLVPADANKDGKIDAGEIIAIIDTLFDGTGEFTFELVNELIEYYFEQE